MTAASTFTFAAFRQFMVFVGCYCLCKYLYFQIPDQIYSDTIYHYAVVTECAGLINLLLPPEQVAAVKNHLISARADLEIIRGCDSAGILFLLVSALLAYPARLKQKLLGILAGVTLVYAMNIVRVDSLYFIVAYRRDWFEFVHVYLAPSLMTLGVLIYFAWWTFACRHDAEPA
ncbi:MAG: exosortase family protein XrtM [Methylomonas sp.]|jgi:exosortase family protein XrtM